MAERAGRKAGSLEGNGFYRLKEEYAVEDQTAGAKEVHFAVSGEISSIYKKDGKVRKVHSLILLPSLEEQKKCLQN